MNIVKRTPLGILLLVMMSVFLFPDGKSGTAGFEIRIVVEKASVRLKPDADSLVLAELRAGTVLEALEKSGEWYKVSLPPDERGFVVVGFIQADFVKVFGEEKEGATPKEFKKEKLPATKPELVRVPERKIRQEPPPPPQEAESFPPPAKGERGGFNIKLSGGMGYFLDGGGDLENVRRGTQNFFSDIGALTNYTSTFDWNKLSLIPDFSAEIIFDFAKYFGIGVGVGVINGTSKGQASWNCDYSESALGLTHTYETSDTIDTSYKISAIPIKFNLYFFMPGSSVSLYVYSGLGLYMGKLTNEMTYDYLYHYTADSTFEFENSETGAISEEATCKKIGLNGGLGLIYKLSSSFGLGLEFYGRMVNLNNWEGDRTESYSGKNKYYTSLLGWYLEVPYEHSGTASGKYWFFKHETSFPGNSYEMMSIAASQPSGNFVSDVRQAEINLNSFSVKLSIIIRFGLF